MKEVCLVYLIDNGFLSLFEIFFFHHRQIYYSLPDYNFFPPTTTCIIQEFSLNVNSHSALSIYTINVTSSIPSLAKGLYKKEKPNVMPAICIMDTIQAQSFAHMRSWNRWWAHQPRTNNPLPISSQPYKGSNVRRSESMGLAGLKSIIKCDSIHNFQ